MTINTTLAGLSQTASLNGPDGSADLPSSLDDAIRYSNSFIAMLRDGAGFTAGAVAAGLGFTPVQQGTGPSQLSNIIKIGWSGAAQLRLAVDGTDFGTTWPMSITGNCSGNAATATNAVNANNLGGFAAAEYARRTSLNVIGIGWTGATISISIDGNNFGGVHPMTVTNANVSNACSGNAATATTAASCSGNAASASNASALQGYVPGNFILASGALSSIGNSGFTQVTASISGTGVFWGCSVSDARLKKNVAPTTQDSLAKIARLDFVQFEFGNLPSGAAVDDGHVHKVGFIAQQAEAIDSEWVVEPEGGFKQPDTFALLCEALHAIKQLNAKVAALEERLAA